MDDWKNIRNWSRDEMMKRVARFRKLKGSDGGLQDSKLPECRRKLYAVIGFQPPMTESDAANSPVGQDASAMPAIDRKSTRLNSSHSQISYAVFCLKKKKKKKKKINIE